VILRIGWFAGSLRTIVHSHTNSTRVVRHRASKVTLQEAMYPRPLFMPTFTAQRTKTQLIRYSRRYVALETCSFYVHMYYCITSCSQTTIIPLYQKSASAEKKYVSFFSIGEITVYINCNHKPVASCTDSFLCPLSTSTNFLIN